MTLVEQAARRIELARTTGAHPLRWVASPQAEATLIAEAPKDAWSDDWERLFGVPLDRGPIRSEWGLDLVLAAR